ncbi:signal peptidase II [Streptococcus sp. DD13]|uniref:signal peptidase II n=1 Tax=Streptococcus sp. DD13 TaxID=1777881 RepID=UPI00082BFED8|nr:signal peptidase II [Streptococcus sp. DD13]
MKRKIGFPVLMVGIVLLDQLVKWYVVSNIPINESRPFIPHILSLSYLRNYGAAYSLLQNQQFLFLVLTFLLIPAFIFLFVKRIKGNLPILFALSFLIAGGIGNFIDRMRWGYVVDMFQTEFINFPVFNVADSFLTIGVIWLMVTLFMEEKNASNN